MHEFRACVNAVHRRQQRQWLWHCVSAGTMMTGLVACFLAIARSMRWFEADWMLLFGVLAVGPVVGCACSVFRTCHQRDAAAAIDQAYGLQDRAVTALEFLEKPTDPTAWQLLQVQDAVEHLSAVSPRAVAPIRVPRTWSWAMGASVVSITIAVIGAPAELAVAETVPDDVVIAQAEKVEDSLKELQEFNLQSLDVEIDAEMDELLSELAERLSELKQPGLDYRDALSGLSEMESALQEKLQQLDSSDTTAELADIGGALSLADEMRVAGDAMSNGNLDKAASELETLQMPELDPQTERAITEHLREFQQNAASGTGRKLKEAVAQTELGLSRNDRKAFRGGMEGLARECQQQVRRKKLSDLLRKQCRLLSECKSECASDSENTGNSKNRNGNSWGQGRSESHSDDPTEKFSSTNRMNIRGEESSDGDFEVESTVASPNAQDAVRPYQNASDRDQPVTESVLDSEPVPLGHRQMIRRYFELIRPRAGEADAVYRRSGSAD